MGDKVSFAKVAEESLDEIIPKKKSKPVIKYSSKFCKQYNADMDNMSRKQLIEYGRALEKKCNKNNKILAKEEDIIIASTQIKYRQGTAKLSERELTYFEKNWIHVFHVLFSLTERFHSYQDFTRTITIQGAFRFALHLRANMIDKIGKEWNQYDIPEKLQKVNELLKQLHNLNVLGMAQAKHEIREQIDKVAETDSHAKYTDIDTVEKLENIKQATNEICIPSFDFDAEDFDLSDNMPEWVNNLEE